MARPAAIAAWGVTLAAAGLLSACSEEKPAPEGPPYQTTNTVHEIMAHVLDPATDVVWASAGTIITAEGEQDLAPVTDEGWLAVVNAAAIVAESGNLLMMPGRAIEEEDWMEFSRGLVDVGVKTMKAAEAKDKDAVFELGGQMYRICTGCHQRYLIGE